MTLHFHHSRANHHAIATLVIGAFLAALLALLPIFHETHNPIIKWMLYLCGLIATGAILVKKLGNWQKLEQVTIDAVGFTSRLYGRVEFSDIEKHRMGRDRAPWRWEITAPSLKLKKQKGGWMHFHLDAHHYAEDLLDYMAFYNQVLGSLEQTPRSKDSTWLPGYDQAFDTQGIRRYGTGEGQKRGARIVKHIGEANRPAALREKSRLVAQSSRAFIFATVILSLSYLARSCTG